MEQITLHEPSLNLSYRVDFREAFQTLQPVEGPISREMILRLEQAMREFPAGEAPVTHHFSEGIYAREMFIPKGTLLTGKIHRRAHLNIISQGDITVLTEAGMRRIRGPAVIESSPGIKRVGYAHADTIWTTIHATRETDLAKIEAEFIAPCFEALEEMQ